MSSRIKKVKKKQKQWNTRRAKVQATNTFASDIQKLQNMFTVSQQALPLSPVDTLTWLQNIVFFSYFSLTWGKLGVRMCVRACYKNSLQRMNPISIVLKAKKKSRNFSSWEVVHEVLKFSKVDWIRNSLTSTPNERLKKLF